MDWKITGTNDFDDTSTTVEMTGIVGCDEAAAFIRTFLNAVGMPVKSTMEMVLEAEESRDEWGYGVVKEKREIDTEEEV